MSNLTPLMKQYWDIKSLHKDKILLFRMGDFFEMFHDDAVRAAPILGIALTQRNKKAADETPMCGMPHHSVAGPINKLLARGFKIAICDQIEDPKLAKGLVKRAVTRILTPGMVYDPDTLEQNKSHYIASLDDRSVSFADVTTGECFYLFSEEEEQRLSWLQALPVAELVVSSGLHVSWSTVVSEHEVEESFVDKLLPKTAPLSAKRLLSYIKSISPANTLQTFRVFEERKLQTRMKISPTVLRHLEVFQNLKGEDQGSLFSSLNRTKTPAGARRFREFLQFPLLNEDEISSRLNSVDFWRGRVGPLKNVREIFARMGDLERRLSKVAYSQANARDVLSLGQGLKTALEALENDRIKEIPAITAEKLTLFTDEIFRTLVEDPPLSIKQGEIIQRGVSETLDEYILLTTESHRLLQEMEAREKERTGISSLKIRYNNVFGYYIEITNTHKDKAPANYQRKQTLSTGERFVTDELLELEKKVITAQSKRYDLEYEIFESLRKKTLELASDILAVACRCSYLDVETSLAWLSLEQNYVRPRFNSAGYIKLESSRHPVVEQALTGRFTPNTIELSSAGCLLLTGPNMAGKSTLMRQVALISLMAQIGSFVPAKDADLPLFDQMFTRIGASDSLTEGLSTFMVEMTETSEMLKAATSRSLLILDEVGRGTSTYDGMALAQSILEHILKNIKCLTLFATHYHELTVLENEFQTIKNSHMSIVDRNGRIEFLHTLKPGPAKKSYGIHVAQIAGLPESLIQRAQLLLKGFEAQSKEKQQLTLMDWQGESESVLPNSWRPEELNLLEELRGFQITEKTPLEALNQIAQWQKSCRDLT